MRGRNLPSVHFSRRAWLLGSAAGIGVLGAGAVSLPGGGPQTFFGGVPPRHELAPLGTRFQPELLRTELTWLVDSMREVGARPFAYCPEPVFQTAYRSTLKAFDKPLDAAEFYLPAARLFASLNDGHCALSLYDFLTTQNRDARILPVVARFGENRVWVGGAVDARLIRGAEIVGIDGISSTELQKNAIALTSGQHRSLRLAFAGSRLPYYLFSRLGSRSHFSVTIRDRSGSTKVVRVSGVPRDQWSKIETGPQDYASNYTFSRLAGARVGYIDYLACENMDHFKTFLHKTFSSIKSDPVDGLVIDIRRNGGGSSDLNDQLWQYVTTKPFSQSGGMEMRVSDRLKREYGFVNYNSIYPLAWFARNETLLDFHSNALVRPGRNELRYSGPVYLLIGAQTFSSALMCAVAAKFYGLATIVGQETGEPVNSTGEVYSGLSPRIGITFSFTTKYFYGPKLYPDMRGVIPDVTITASQAHRASGRDPVLEYAIHRILGRALGQRQS